MNETELERTISTSDSSSGQKNRRISSRRRQYKGATIAYQDGHMTIDCVVRDISEVGAKIRVNGSVAPPDQFSLRVELDAMWVDCEVIWRDGEFLGVRFLNEIKKVATTRLQIIQNGHRNSVLRKLK